MVKKNILFISVVSSFNFRSTISMNKTWNKYKKIWEKLYMYLWVLGIEGRNPHKQLKEDDPN